MTGAIWCHLVPLRHLRMMLDTSATWTMRMVEMDATWQPWSDRRAGTAADSEAMVKTWSQPSHHFWKETCYLDNFRYSDCSRI